MICFMFGRSSGCTRQHVARKSNNFGGQIDGRVRRKLSRTTRMHTSAGAKPSYGNFASVNTSHAVMPYDHTSERVEYVCERIASIAIQRSGPIAESV